MRNQVTEIERRRLLALVGIGATTGLAGCGGGGGEGGEDTPQETTEPAATSPPTETTAAGTTAGGEEVPEEYRTATAISGSQRDPDALSSKDAVNYQSEPNEGNQCSGCQFYIPDKNGDGLGACSIVAGTIDPNGWCTSYVAAETTEGSLDRSGPESGG
ncbi:hypothetical protein BRC83_09530 [Halobacteriales archaeon QS_1_68_17]|nr:MAG: hypothetical protein BRC83_09530 [Halobacteriales archaeon QS_1_68_17]